MRDWTDQPEAAGPQSESGLERPGPVASQPDADPSLAAIERTWQAERAADALKTVPEDVLEVS